MSRKTAVHVRYNSCYISLPSFAKSALLSGEREPQRLNFVIFISNLSPCSGFSFVIVLTLINKVNNFRVTRDSLVDCKFSF